MAEQLEQHFPEEPTNVQSDNPYIGLDRGLFLGRGDYAGKYARIHAARLRCVGPSAAVSVMQYQVMVYEAKPEMAADYAAGTVINAADGTPWFDCLTRGSVLTGISAEYWAIDSFLLNYTTGGPKLSQDEIDRNNNQAQVFTETMGSWVGLKAVELTVAFNAVNGQPLSRTAINLGVDYIKDGVTKHIDQADLPTTPFDAVREALKILKTAP